LGTEGWLWGNESGIFAIIPSVFTYFATVLACFPVVLNIISYILSSIACVCGSWCTGISLLSRFSRLLPYFASSRYDISAVLTHIA
jgi:hypothetical protein